MSLKGKRQLYTYKSLAPEVKGRHMEALIVANAFLEESEQPVFAGKDGETGREIKKKPLQGAVQQPSTGDIFC
jgi:hypothetical protein